MPTPEKEIWQKIELVYVTTDKPLTELAKQFKVSYKTLRNKCAKGKWGDKREKNKEALLRSQIEEVTTTNKKIKDDFDRCSEIVCQVAAATSAKTVKDMYEGAIPITQGGLRAHLDIIKQSQDILYRRLGVPPPKTIIGIEAENAFKTYQERLAVETAMLNELAGRNAKVIDGELSDPVNSKGNGHDNGKMVDGRFMRLELTEPVFEDLEPRFGGEEEEEVQGEDEPESEQGEDSNE